MATAALIPISEYLRTAYEPDAEYVDGVIEERPMGELDHSDLQTRLVGLLMAYTEYFRCNTEWRVQVAPTRFRIPDVCLRKSPVTREQIGQTPPLVCIEILSPEDRMSRMLVKVGDYLAMGVEAVWVVDSVTRCIYVHSAIGTAEYTEGAILIPGTPVILQLADLFSILDEN